MRSQSVQRLMGISIILCQEKAQERRGWEETEQQAYNDQSLAQILFICFN